MQLSDIDEKIDEKTDKYMNKQLTHNLPEGNTRKLFALLNI